jgi:hypothetical protein
VTTPQGVPVRLAEAEPARLDLRLKTVQQVRLGSDLMVVTRDLRAAFVWLEGPGGQR